MSKKDAMDTWFHAIKYTSEMQNAYDAALAYEKNCRAKYDRFNMHSLPIPKGQQMSDFANQYGTTVEEMKKFECQIELYLGKNI
jgi:hypothetical protein